MLTDDSGQNPTDGSLNDLLARGSPAIFIPSQRFVRTGGEIALLFEALQMLARQLPDAHGIECGFVNAALRFIHIPQGSAFQPPDALGRVPATSPTCDTMLRGGVVKMLARFSPPGTIRGHGGVPSIQASSCTVRNMDDKQSSSTRVNSAYRDFPSPAWQAFTDLAGDPMQPAEAIFKLDFLRYGELKTSDVFYQESCGLEQQPRCVDTQRVGNRCGGIYFLFSSLFGEDSHFD